MRSGSETNIQSGTNFFVAAVYTGSDANPREGATITGKWQLWAIVGCRRVHSV